MKDSKNIYRSNEISHSRAFVLNPWFDWDSNFGPLDCDRSRLRLTMRVRTFTYFLIHNTAPAR